MGSCQEDTSADYGSSASDSLLLSPTYRGRSRRDSGYGTDSSPGAFSPTKRQFTFKSETDACMDLEDMDIHDELVDENVLKDDVFSDGTVASGYGTDYDSDAADKEVEELFGNSAVVGQSDTEYQKHGLNLVRPPAPVPISEQCVESRLCNIYETDSYSSEESLDLTNSYFHHLTPCGLCNSLRRYYFRPIGNRIRSPGNQIHSSVTGILNKPCSIHNNQVGRVRLRSEGDGKGISGPLPDVVPNECSRPVSMPDLIEWQLRHEQEMGRELRRIGDEFYTSFNKGPKPLTLFWNTFTCSFNFHLSGYLKTMKRMLSPSPEDNTSNR